MSESQPEGYRYFNSEPDHLEGYLWQPLLRELEGLKAEQEKRRVFDLGCGNGSFAAELTKRGYQVTGVDPSPEGVQVANQAHPNIVIRQGSAYDDLKSQYGQFPIVVSLEVVEHVFYPRKFAKTVFDLLEPGGTAYISTPYHGYLKNLALALTDKMDHHFSALWDYGHIKFWSFKTMTQLFREVDLEVERFLRVGRIPVLAKSMVAIVKKS